MRRANEQFLLRLSASRCGPWDPSSWWKFTDGFPYPRLSAQPVITRSDFCWVQTKNASSSDHRRRSREANRFGCQEICHCSQMAQQPHLPTENYSRNCRYNHACSNHQCGLNSLQTCICLACQCMLPRLMFAWHTWMCRAFLWLLRCPCISVFEFNYI